MNRILVYGMTDNLGGIESYVMNEMALLDKSKAAFDFIVDFPEMSYSREATALGSKIHFIPAKGKKLFAHLKAFYKVLKAHPEYKKVYFNILDAGAAFSMLIPWIMGRKIIVHSHSSNTAKMKLHRLCKPFVNLFASKRLACSKVAAEYMFGAKQAVIIPNSIDCEKYLFNENKRTKIREQLNIEENQFVICCVGRLSPEKNLFRLLEIFGEILKKNTNSVLLSVGDGPQKEELKDFANRLGVADKVRFLGRRNDVCDILQACDCFVMTSFFEGLSIVAIEAQASGLPCIFSGGMSVETKLNPNVCFVSLEESSEEWAKAILGFQNEPRVKDVSALQKAGYDRNAPNDAQKELLEYLYS